MVLQELPMIIQNKKRHKRWEKTVEKDWETGGVARKEGTHRREDWTNRFKVDKVPTLYSYFLQFHELLCIWQINY